MNATQSAKSMKDWLALQPKEVRDNLEVVSTEEIPSLIRIDYKTPKVLIPRLPEKTMRGENSSCPRVSMAPHLSGCVLGYGAIIYEHIDGAEGYIHDGEYEISKVDFQHAVIPNNKLVPDSTLSQEVWLVNYAPEYKEYTPEVIGSLFVKRSIVERINSGKSKLLTYDTYIKIDTSKEVYISKDQVLSRGFYQALFVDNGSRNTYKSTDHIFREISKENYDKAVKLRKSGSYTPAFESIPAWAKW